MRIFILTILLTFTTAHAQDSQGRNTPGNWRVTHHAIHDIWNVMCDERGESAALEQRCYIRHVDVFSPAPDFAAQFVFVTPESGGGHTVDFGMERGTRFDAGGFRLERAGEIRWQTDKRGCLRGGTCTFQDDDAADMLSEMQAGGALRFQFIDRNGTAQDLTWNLAEFAAAMSDFTRQAAARDLFD